MPPPLPERTAIDADNGRAAAPRQQRRERRQIRDGAAAEAGPQRLGSAQTRSQRLRSSESDPQRLRSAVFLAFFLRVLKKRMRGAFHAVRLAKPGVPAVPDDAPLIVYCNHPSWWDAALLPVLMAELFPRRATYGPIDADALQRYKFMRRLGFFGVAAGSYAGAATFLRVGRDLLARNDTLFCITPQGGFVDVRARPVRLQPGLAGLIASVPRVTVLPLAIDYPFWDERTPEALLRFGTLRAMGRALPTSLVDVEQRLASDLAATMDRLADDGISRDPGRFDVLVAGRSGVGGVYDGWRRLRAWSRGERFVAAHGRRQAPASIGDERATAMTVPTAGKTVEMTVEMTAERSATPPLARGRP